MVAKQALEEVITKKVKPIIKETTSKFLGVSVEKLNEDITSLLHKPTLLGIKIDMTLPFKDAKKKFKQQYLEKLLKLHFGNITEVARLTQTDRRSIHRLLNDLHIDAHKIKQEMVKPYAVQLSALNVEIEQVLDKYKEVLHPEKLRSLYRNVDVLSDEILKELPEQPLSLSEALLEFEKKYVEEALKFHEHNIAKTARTIGLRYEVLHRKAKKLKLI
ncbi:hypothetical protein HYY69_06870 [Candidatus Woesearchaeota archaeon]|nr:hypothetical protein [Candidatus Woesearchaeota archaeon]